jgi:hypothetical protein
MVEVMPMRAGPLAGVFLIGTALPALADSAGPRAQPAPPTAQIRPHNFRIRLYPGFRMKMPNDDARLMLGRQSRQETQYGVSFHLGPFRTTLGGNGRKAGIANYRLEGVDLFGGSISGQVNGRGARIYVRWPLNLPD